MTATQQFPARATGARAGQAAGRSFWIVTAILFLYLFASSAPSPLYSVYAAQWHFSAISITAVFGVYALALLATLLVAGALSDSVGRKPVILTAMVFQLAALALFLAATDVGWLYAARIVQGCATGLVTAPVAAALVDLQPPGRDGLAGTVNGTVPIAGMAGGVLVSGILVQYAPAPTRLVFWLLLATFTVLIVILLAFVPETVTERRPAKLRVRIGVERAVRPAFLSAVPALVACLALVGLYMSLGPSLALAMQHSHNALLGAADAFLLGGCGALAGVLVRTWPPRRAMSSGCAVLVAGVAITVAGVAATAPALLYLGTVIAGSGFGAGFLGAFRMLVRLARADRRSELIAAIYVVVYLAFSLPGVVAGVVSTHIGLDDTAIGYGIVVAAFALIALPATIRYCDG